jgi:exodeoxyribonuclease V alpha subunit
MDSMKTIEETLNRLNTSKFRSSFHLSAKDKNYVREKGMEMIQSHARDFVKMKLADASPINDGKQTPMSGHPVFKAMHATGCCCRGCLNKWYRVPLNVPLSDLQQEKIGRLLMAWIERQMSDRMEI